MPITDEQFFYGILCVVIVQVIVVGYFGGCMLYGKWLKMQNKGE
jgi:hypothetical protein